MKILHPGIENANRQPKRFLCTHCGCYFEAEKGEYSYGPQWDPECTCECPNCGWIATEKH